MTISTLTTPVAARAGASPPAVRLRGLTKRFGAVTAVDDLTFDVLPGRVTGFLGPNGSGKTTTMRLVLGLDRPTAGTARIGDLPYARLARPMRTVGALLDARAVHPGRTAGGHLRALAASNGLSRRRVDEVLGTVGLADVAGRRTAGFSLGMLQRLAVAGALLGDPGVLLFDEPVNGLDPEGVRWVRGLLRGLAAQGRTVLVSSHLMAEMALTADHVVVIGRGRLIADEPVTELLDVGGRVTVALDPQAPPDGVAAVTAALARAGGRVAGDGVGGALVVTGLDALVVGRAAASCGVALARLETERPSLEDVFLDLTEGSGDYTTTAGSHQAGSSR